MSGTHGSGKTTLIDDFMDVHREYGHELEPYWALVQEGVVFVDGPNVDDLEQQLESSARMILDRSREPDVIFDRCPIDFVAYLEAVTERQGSEWAPSAKQLRNLERAMAALDLVVFLPLSRPDEIDVAIEYPKLRRAVDARLKVLIREDPLELLSTGRPRRLELRGSRQDRLRDLKRAIA